MEIMTLSRKIGLVIYVSIIILNVISLTAIYFNAKKKPDFYRLFAANATILAWLYLGIIEALSKGTWYFPIAVRCTMLPITFLGAVWIYFVVHYVNVVPEKYHKWLKLLFIPPAITYAAFLVPQLEPLVISEMLGDIKVVRWGPWVEANVFQSRVYIVASVVLLIWKMRRERKRHLNTILLIGSLMFPFAIDLLNDMGVMAYPDFDLTVVSLSLYLLMVVNMVFKHRMIDIFPFASHEIFTRIQDPIVIINSAGVITDFNSAAETFFSGYRTLSAGVEADLFIEDVLGDAEINNALRDRITVSLDNPEHQVVEENLKVQLINGHSKMLGVSIIPVQRGGIHIGKLIHFRDITVFNQTVLKGERVRLSADLHDSMGNCLSVISSNLEFVLNRYQPEDKVKDCVKVAYDKTLNAYMDLRRIVENLRPLDIESNGLIWALESLFKKIRGRGIRVEFYYEYIRPKTTQAIEIEGALYHICQEALTNAIVHGTAPSISYVLIQGIDSIDLFITDDGRGSSEITENKGISGIRHRVLSLGGSFTYSTREGGGFTHKISIPCMMSETAAEGDLGVAEAT